MGLSSEHLAERILSQEVANDFLASECECRLPPGRTLCVPVFLVMRPYLAQSGYSLAPCVQSCHRKAAPCLNLRGCFLLKPLINMFLNVICTANMRGLFWCDFQSHKQLFLGTLPRLLEIGVLYSIPAAWSRAWCLLVMWEGHYSLPYPLHWVGWFHLKQRRFLWEETTIGNLFPLLVIQGHRMWVL